MTKKTDPAKPVDILDIDATSYATAVGHAAASRAFCTLAGRDDLWVWWGGAPDTDDPEAEKIVQTLGAYVCRAPFNAPPMAGETAFRKAVEMGFTPGPASGWNDLPAPERLAFSIFSRICRAACWEMQGLQGLERGIREAAEPGPQIAHGPDEDDDALEEHESIDAMEHLSGPRKKRASNKASSKKK